jgi:hypothetical protein
LCGTAIVEIVKRYRAQGSTGLEFARTEGCRPGHYCFMDMSEVLVRKVLGQLVLEAWACRRA